MDSRIKTLLNKYKNKEITRQQAIVSWQDTAENHVIRSFNGYIIELTSIDSTKREFSTGPSNRRKKHFEMLRALCLLEGHRGKYFKKYYYDGECQIGRLCSKCDLYIWYKWL